MNCASHADSSKRSVLHPVRTCALQRLRPHGARQCVLRKLPGRRPSSLIANLMASLQVRRHRPLAEIIPELHLYLGLIPGVGAIYNGEYFKAAIHVLIFGMLTSLRSAAFWLWPFILHAVRGLLHGEEAKTRGGGSSRRDADRSILRTASRAHRRIKDKEFWGGVGLIVLGALYLLDSFDLISFRGAGVSGRPCSSPRVWFCCFGRGRRKLK